jgi:hypothetical protein
MARKPSSRVVLNREAVEAIRLGSADGLHAAAEAIQDTVRPPDAEPYGRGLVKREGTATYVDGKKVAGTGTAPRGAAGQGIVTVFGWGFPARFNELGTSRQPARPFFTPAVAAGIAQAAPEVAEGITLRLRRVRS